MATLRHWMTELQNYGLEQISSLGHQPLSLQSRAGEADALLWERTQSAIDKSGMPAILRFSNRPETKRRPVYECGSRVPRSC